MNSVMQVACRSDLTRAIEIACAAHEGQTSEHTGEPAICHVMRVMAAGRTDDERIVGALHDVVEDSDWTVHRLYGQRFADHIIAAVDAITRRGHAGVGETYWDYIERVKLNTLARAVKILDLHDNIKRSEGIALLESLHDRYRRALFSLQVSKPSPSRDTL